MAEMATIVLAGRSFALRPLTLRQLRVVLPAFVRAASLADEPAIDGAIDILAASLGRDHPEMTRDALLELEILPGELAAAVGAVARLSGLVSPGEAQAGG
jgi:hypothetical protein